MIHEHAIFLAVWLGTGSAGLVLGLVGVRQAKKRLHVRHAAPAGASRKSMAA